METKILSVRVPLRIVHDLERAASIGSMTLAETHKAALESYVLTEKPERSRRSQVGALKELAAIHLELKRAVAFVSLGRFSGEDIAAWRAAIDAVKAAAEKIAP